MAAVYPHQAGHPQTRTDVRTRARNAPVALFAAGRPRARPARRGAVDPRDAGDRFGADRVALPRPRRLRESRRPARTGIPGDPRRRARKEAWQNAARRPGRREAARAGAPRGLAAATARRSRDAARRTTREFLRALARDTWRGLDALTDRDHGLPVDHVRFCGGSLDASRAKIGDYTNVTNIGLYLMATVGGRRSRAASPRDAGHGGRAPRARRRCDQLETAPGLLLQLLRHHLARAHQQLRLLRRLGLADGGPDRGAPGVPRARRESLAR